MHIRKIITVVDEARSEAGIAATPPLRKVAAVAIVGNPFAGRYQSDLSSLVTASAALGEEVSAIALAALGPYPVESYGKGAVIGLAGEQEHGVALLTTVFGNVIRATAGGGKAWISSLTKRAAPGASIDVPLAHKDALYVRSHYDGITVALPDAPLPDEIAIICAYANRGRLNHRVGGLASTEIQGLDGLV
ncbi:amino acid synthesis family protein [Bradyrhizobium sp. U87765 SZCCT0131]|uniref:amino acid synthesis family protein n=1 Tax=unclassified Bradyrhizobium TaxID=2631580 RepID=UPI001BAC0B45|nr:MULTISPECIES: amino acid synthesis family protein [unclassified Bradyrhizobium]MBR1223046.1 amino acid synthesis family protein [Bradyrhizobium sp. U87765 SZCCT0131]MBR1262782.1 amino acid synthesis family protein [Bradyrhizobium sp. U87765 SZCCT0134]MBR1308746.1 amino acid synthesis family protein [Bradyrhizobium sp. U87765 SZCCT0110]MBR1318564.1 amino acid synthesis family protein [Bradyrhizobium sp. U87765 SZCCT0109]MBR1352268.1 amino acid synthesis family protein [Bradyrhizobium sp. U87